MKQVRRIKPTQRSISGHFCLIVLAVVISTSASASYFSNTLILANKGDVQAQIEIADNHLYTDFNSDDIPEYGKAFTWYMKAANQGSAKAQNRVAEMYKWGQGTTKDINKALAWYEKAAKQGDGDAQYSIGAIYEMDTIQYKNINQDYIEAFEWYMKAAMNDANPVNNISSAAKNKLGDFYYYGKGVPQDYAKAFDWYQRAGKYSIGRVAKMYYDGLGVPQDYTKALESYLQFVDANSNLKARTELGFMYYEGKGTTKDYHEALRWFNEAADRGDSSAEFMLGLMYYYGEGVRQDYSKALDWYMKAAQQDVSTAQLSIGGMHLDGRGVRQSKDQAKEWFGKSCDNGDQDGCDMYKKLNN